MENKALIRFVEIDISDSDTLSLTEDQKAALAVLCFAVSEINCLSKLYLMSEQNLKNSREIDAAISIQRGVLLRTWSSKLFEIGEFFNTKDPRNKTDNKVLLELAEKAHLQINEFKEHEGYKFARSIRHEAAFHYRLDQARKKLSWCSSEIITSMYFHKMWGNGFYPFGEEVVFIGEVNRTIRSKDDENRASSLLNSWVEWLGQMSKCLNNIFADYVEVLVTNKQPDRMHRNNLHWIDPKLVDAISDVNIPVFFRND